MPGRGGCCACARADDGGGDRRRRCRRRDSSSSSSSVVSGQWSVRVRSRRARDADTYVTTTRIAHAQHTSIPSACTRCAKRFFTTRTTSSCTESRRTSNGGGRRLPGVVLSSTYVSMSARATSPWVSEMPHRDITHVPQAWQRSRIIGTPRMDIIYCGVCKCSIRSTYASIAARARLSTN